jgi:hypothetical protein
VAKATSDTLFGTGKSKRTNDLEQRHSAIYGYKRRNWRRFKWWFENIHPERIKMSIKLYSFRTKNREMAR